jgi:hypothetical protein
MKLDHDRTPESSVHEAAKRSLMRPTQGRERWKATMSITTPSSPTKTPPPKLRAPSTVKAIPSTIRIEPRTARHVFSQEQRPP